MKLLGIAAVFLLLTIAGASAFLLDPGAAASGCSSGNYTACYDELQNSQWANGNVTRNVSGRLVVPWYSTSSSCLPSDLQSGGNCNIGTVNNSQYCMVSDEHSVVVRNVALGTNQTRMDLAYNSIIAMKGSYGQLPGWRCLVNQTTSTINCTDSRVNSNGDSASDASARYVYALFVAANNSNFNSTARQNYYNLAVNLTADMYQYETVRTCYNSTQGYGQVCVFAGGGANVVSSGMTASDFMYTGYFGDIIVAYQAAYKATGNTTYLAAARNISLQYLDAANWTGAAFTATPGKSFKYTITATKPVAVCTNTCGPDQWDSIDAPRAFSLGVAQYYAMNASLGTLPGLQTYLNQWYARHLGIIGNAPIQYYPNGTASSTNKTDYYSVGLMAYLAAGASQANFEAQLDNAMSHYSSSPKTWDWVACYGVYGQQSPTWALGVGVGRDNGLFQFSVAPLTANVSVTIYSTNTSAILNTTNVTARLTYSTGSSTVTTQNGTAFYQNLLADSYTLTLNASGYETAQYTFTMTAGVNVNVTAYLTPTSTNETGNASVLLNILDFDTGQSLEGALVLMAKDVNGTLTTVQSKNSDVTGRVYLTYIPSTRYTFTISKGNYTSKTFSLDPIIFTSYDVRLARVYASSQNVDYSGVNVYLTPQNYKANAVNNMYASITSPGGSLTSYNISIDYPGGSYFGSGVDATGQIFTSALSVGAASPSDTVNVTYCYDTTNGPARCFVYKYSLIVNSTSTNWLKNKDATYGLGLLDRAIIAVIAVIIIVGVSTALAGPLVSIVLGLLMLGFFVVIGFLPIWTILLSVLLGVIMISRRSGE